MTKFVFTLDTSRIKGEKGDKGDRGERGIQGERGPNGPRGLQGYRGEAGPMGQGIVIRGYAASFADLPATAEIGDSYVVDRDLLVYIGANSWQNMGEIRGPQGAQGIQGPRGDAGPEWINWRGNFAANLNMAVGDGVLYYNPATFQNLTLRCITPHTTGSTPNLANFETVVVSPVGPQGPAGQAGATGPMGPRGFEGQRGADGASYVYRGFSNELLNQNLGVMDTFNHALIIDNRQHSLLLKPKTARVLTPASLIDVATIATNYDVMLSSAQGLQGDRGPQGLQGPAGTTGPAGPQGLQGPAGLEYVHVGSTASLTNNQWLEANNTINHSMPVNGQIVSFILKPRIRMQYTAASVASMSAINTNYTILIEAYQGAQGVQGAVGPAGPTGPRGEQGFTGSPGVTGPAGPQGNPGTPGAMGPAGPTGAKGDTGDRGIQGLPGSVGPAGPRGSDGPVGPTGPQGTKGMNWRGAYAAATNYIRDDVVSSGGASYILIVDNSVGVTPTNTTNWAPVATRGATGPQGATGPAGPVGPQGIQGIQGEPGAGADVPYPTDLRVVDTTLFLDLNQGTPLSVQLPVSSGGGGGTGEPPVIMANTLRNPPFGSRLGVLDSESSRVFNNVMKQAWPWQASNYGTQWAGLVAAGHMTDGGQLISIEPGSNGFYTRLFFNQPAVAGGSGRYRMRWLGTAQIDLNGVQNINRDITNEIWFDFTANGQSWADVNVRTIANGPIREISIVHEDDIESFDNGEIFRRQYVESLRNERVLRFDEWIGILRGENDGGLRITTWESRPLPTDEIYMYRFVPYEVMAALCLEVGADMWVCLPTAATLDHFEKAAELIQTLMPAPRHVYAEYTTKTWDFSGTPQAHYCAEQGRIAFGTTGAPTQQEFRSWYSMQSTQMALLWREVWGTSDRMHPVIQTQADWLNSEIDILTAPMWLERNGTLGLPPYVDPRTVFDYLTVHAQIDGGLSYHSNDALINTWRTTLTQTEAFNRMRDQLLDARYWAEPGYEDENRNVVNLTGKWQHFLDYIQPHGMELAIYEVGNHLNGAGDSQAASDFLYAFSVSAQMGEVYTATFNALKSLDINGPMCFSVDIRQPDVNIIHGLQRYLGDENPAWQAVNTLKLLDDGPAGRGQYDFVGTYELISGSLDGSGGGSGGTGTVGPAGPEGPIGPMGPAGPAGTSMTLQVVTTQAAFDAAVATDTHWVVRYV